MGSVYKLTDEIKQFILQMKREQPALSCRKLSMMIQEKFNAKVSKSSINIVFKGSGLSMPVGRTRKRQRRPALKIFIVPTATQIPVVNESQVVKEPEAITPVIEEQEEVISILPEAKKENEPVKKDVVTEPQKVEEIVLQPIDKQEVTKEKPVIAEQPIIEPEPVKPIEQSQEGPATQPVTQEPVREEEPYEIKKPSVPTQEVQAVLSEGIVSGAIFLKAIESLVCGVNRINDIIRSRMRISSADYAIKTEALLFANLFDSPPFSKIDANSVLWALVNKRFSADEIASYLNDLQGVEALMSDISRVFPDLLKEVKGLKINLSTSESLYLDGSLHTVWSTQYIPSGFNSTVCKTDTYIKSCFQQGQPLILFTAPGYETPTDEFINLLVSFSSPLKKNINSISLYGNKLEEFNSLLLEQLTERKIIFGLWPWQYVQYRKVNKIKDYKPLFFEPLKKEFYVADIELELSQANGNNKVTLNGYAIKYNPSEKIRLVILSNFPQGSVSAENICLPYFTKWPNIEEAFSDFSRKIELFTYTAGSQLSPFSESADSLKELSTDAGSFLKSYLKLLHVYFKYNILPASYENKDFPTIKSLFYDIDTLIKPQTDHYAVLFKPPVNYPALEDLKYACRRMNEQNCFASDGKRYWFFC